MLPVKNADGHPVSGATVRLDASGDGNSLTQPGGPTGSDGVATGSFRSSEAGQKTIRATVNGSVQISQTATVEVPPPASGAHPVYLSRCSPPIPRRAEKIFAHCSGCRPRLDQGTAGE